MADLKRTMYIRERVLNIARLETGKPVQEMLVGIAIGAAEIALDSCTPGGVDGISIFMDSFASAINEFGGNVSISTTHSNGMRVDSGCKCPSCCERRQNWKGDLL